MIQGLVVYQEQEVQGFPVSQELPEHQVYQVYQEEVESQV